MKKFSALFSWIIKKFMCMTNYNLSNKTLFFDKLIFSVHDKALEGRQRSIIYVQIGRPQYKPSLLFWFILARSESIHSSYMTWSKRPLSYCDVNGCNVLTWHFMNRCYFLMRTTFSMLCCVEYGQQQKNSPSCNQPSRPFQIPWLNWDSTRDLCWTGNCKRCHQIIGLWKAKEITLTWRNSWWNRS